MGDRHKALLLFTMAVLCLHIPIFSGTAESGAARRDEPSNGGFSRLNLFTKNPSDWKIEPGSARGTLLFRQESGAFSFHAEKLEPLTEYALVRYADSPPFADLISQGRTDRLGELHLSGTWRLWTRKFWLVPAADVERSGDKVRAKGWHPQRYLFEEKELGVPCSCEE